MSTTPLPQDSCLISPYTFWDTLALAKRYVIPDRRVSSIKPAHWTREQCPTGATSCSILFLGDLMVGSTSVVGPRLSTVLGDVDRVVINLESPVVPKKPVASYWERVRNWASQALLSFSASTDYLDHIFGSLDKDKVIFTIANNHANDRHVDQTIQTLHEAGYCNLVGHDTEPFIITTRTGARIGLLGCSTLMNWGRYDSICLANDLFALANTHGGNLLPIKERLNLQSLALTIHWDHEYSAVPSKVTEAAAQKLMDIGFDAIVGHGPHIVQRMDILRHRVEEVPVAYSIGNFASRRLNTQNASGFAHVLSFDVKGTITEVNQWAFYNDGTCIELIDGPEDGGLTGRSHNSTDNQPRSAG